MTIDYFENGEVRRPHLGQRCFATDSSWRRPAGQFGGFHVELRLVANTGREPSRKGHAFDADDDPTTLGSIWRGVSPDRQEPKNMCLTVHIVHCIQKQLYSQENTNIPWRAFSTVNPKP